MKHFYDFEDLVEEDDGSPWGRIAIGAILVLLPLAGWWDKKSSAQRRAEFLDRMEARETALELWLEESFPGQAMHAEELGEWTTLTFFGIVDRPAMDLMVTRIREKEGVEAWMPIVVEFRRSRPDWAERNGRIPEPEIWRTMPALHRDTIEAEPAE